MKEMVLYYNPKTAGHTAKLKGVLVRMGVRIKNIAPDQVMQKVGYLAGIPGFEAEAQAAGAEMPVIEEEILVMKNFTGRRIDELLFNLRKAGVPKINLKAIVTEQNCGWTFYHLYEEIKEEHRAMTDPQEAMPRETASPEMMPQQAASLEAPSDAGQNQKDEA